MGYWWIGLGLPVFTGIALVLALAPKSLQHPYQRLETAAYGFLFGVFLSSMTVHAAQLLQIDIARFTSVVLVMLLMLGVGSIYRQRVKLTAVQSTSTAFATNRCLRLVWWMVLALALFRGFQLAQEVMLRPTFPWDAWTTWEYRVKIWALFDPGAYFVQPGAWLATPGTEAFPVAAAQYPALVGRYQLWLAQWLPQWNEPLLHVPWLVVFAALGGMFYGQSRQLGLRPVAAIIAMYLLASVPLLNTHIALAGYRDIWIAAALLAALGNLVHWTTSRSYGRLWLAAMFLLMAAFTKQEGLVWAVILAIAFLVGNLHRRYLLAVGFASAGLATLVLLAGGIDLHFGATRIEISTDQLVLPYLGTIHWHFANVTAPVLNSLFASRNWHLMFFVIGVTILLIPFRRRLVVRPVRLLNRTCALSALGLIVLFYATEASQWAIAGTSLNRILLQWLPVWWLWAVANLIQAAGEPGRAPRTALTRE